MQYQFFMIPVNFSTDAAEELNRFLKGHRIASVDKVFVPNGTDSFWSFCVSWQEREIERDPIKKKEKVDYKEILTESDFALYVKLRDLRKILAEQEGVPLYALFTNEQLAEMVKGKVTSASSLAKIGGVGKARIDKYGKAFLDLLLTEIRDQPETIKEKDPETI